MQYPSTTEQLKCAILLRIEEQTLAAQLKAKEEKPGEGWRRIGSHDIWFHSKLHANYARYLEALQTLDHLREWQYKPQIFKIKGIRGGYAPSFRITRQDGTHFWVEVDSSYEDFDLVEKILFFQYAYPSEELFEDTAYWIKQNVQFLKRIISSWEE